MLKINFSETPGQERWILYGRLTNPWVQELRAYWRKKYRAAVGRACIVDLDEVNPVELSSTSGLRFFSFTKR